MLLAASTQTSIGLVILFLAFVIGVAFAFINIRQARPEVGSEIELAANRKPYLSDEELEGRKLDRTLSFGLLGLVVIGVGLPLYWLQEPGRQENAVADMQRKFVDRGAELFATTEEGGNNCAFCHGAEGVGAATPFTLTDANGRYVKEVNWQGPALNTVLLRFDRDEVRYILEYGRPFSPMPAWGAKGGGALTTQNIQNLIDYMTTIQLTPEEAQAEVTEQAAKMLERKDQACVDGRVEAARVGLSAEELEAFDASTVDTESCPPMYESLGDALFNMGYDDGFAGGAYSCGRCHTKGWSYGEKQADGGGAFGPPLTNVVNQFPGTMGVQQQVDFVCVGSDDGTRYGQSGMGSGRMPGYCVVPAIESHTDSNEVGVIAREAGTAEQGGMFTEAQVRAVVEYERSLHR
ncbi:MAG: c-type cytochrome [Acidimicrobiales bacterium]|nr:c-type cytochrome [Acidimicrobiales bacterium]